MGITLSHSIARVVPWLNIVGLTLIIAWVVFRLHRSPSRVQLITRGLQWLTVFQWLMLALFAVLLWFSVRHTSNPQAYLPPYSTYYYDKIAQNAVTYISGWVAAGVLFFLLWYVFLRKRTSAPVDAADVLLFVFGAACVGWPDIFVFLALTFVVAVVWMIVLLLFRKRTLQDRLIITPAILPAAIITLFIASWVLSVTHLDAIRF